MEVQKPKFGGCCSDIFHKGFDAFVGNIVGFQTQIHNIFEVADLQEPDDSALVVVESKLAKIVVDVYEVCERNKVRVAELVVDESVGDDALEGRYLV